MHPAVIGAACPTPSFANLVQGHEASAVISTSMRIIPRSREVGQSYLTSIWTTLVALWMAFVIVYQEQPQLVRNASCQKHAPKLSCSHVFVARLAEDSCTHAAGACERPRNLHTNLLCGTVLPVPLPPVPC